MKLTCPNCAAKYTIPEERLTGRRRLKIRCKRCVEPFVVDVATEAPPEAPTAEPARIKKEARRSADLFAGLSETGDHAQEVVTSLTPSPRESLVGERNENSVLFSLASFTTPEAPREASTTPSTTTTTESSALIDIRALCGTIAKDDASSSSSSALQIDDIVNLGGGVFTSPLLAAPDLPSVSDDSAPTPARNRTSLLVLIGAASVLIATTAVVTIVMFTRERVTTTAATIGTQATQTPIAPIASSTIPMIMSAAPSVTEDPPTPAHSAVASKARVSTSATARVASSATIATTATAAPTTTTTTKCCPGESETTCHMRLAVGAPCGDRATSSTTTPAPFDRASATRALVGVNVSSCKHSDGPTGPGHARITFQPAGTVSAVEVEAPYGGTAVGSCVAQKYRSATIPAFTGAALTVGKGFSIP